MCKHVCLSKYNIKTIFVDFSVFYGILFLPKDQVLNPCFFVSGFSGRPTGPPTGPPSLKSVDRRSTDVHRRARLDLAGGRSTETVDRPESSALWKGPGRPSGRPDRETYSLYPGSVDRPVDRRHNGLKYDRWSVGKAVNRQA